MEEGTKAKRTVFVGGIADGVDEAVIYEHFSTFGDIIEVQLPTAAVNPGQEAEAGHRGFAFVTYGSSGDAQDAIDNMDLNELKGRVIKVNLARPSKGATQPFGRAIWESEEWLKENAKPLAQSGGVVGRTAKKDARVSDEAVNTVDDQIEE